MFFFACSFIGDFRRTMCFHVEMDTIVGFEAGRRGWSKWWWRGQRKTTVDTNQSLVTRFKSWSTATRIQRSHRHQGRQKSRTIIFILLLLVIIFYIKDNKLRLRDHGIIKFRLAYSTYHRNTNIHSKFIQFV